MHERIVPSPVRGNGMLKGICVLLMRVRECHMHLAVPMGRPGRQNSKMATEYGSNEHVYTHVHFTHVDFLLPSFSISQFKSLALPPTYRSYQPCPHPPH